MSVAMEGEGGAYIPCNELAAPLPALPEGAIRGQGGGFIARDEGAAAVLDPPFGAIRGSGTGFVPKPCITGCIDQTNLGRDLATSWIFSRFLTPDMDTYLNRTPTERTIYGFAPVDEWFEGIHQLQTFYSYRHHYLPEPYPGSPVCWINEGDPGILPCPPFTTWEHRIARVPTDIGSAHPWHVILGDLNAPFTFDPPSFDPDLQWEYQLMGGDWGTGTPVDGTGTVLLEGTASYNDGRKELDARLTGTTLDPYVQFYIRLKDTPPGSARVQVALTDDGAHERILRQCYLP